ncbi:TadE family type IV pilus minor pilin [Zhihengliuella salsuginis]|uniref:TadE-like protein n=1 Tax=Zhihengliuella salsuginis TaxID=578222 RepID=A0ABQ3GDV1_9MICC|nr:TadE family type IV pilus minor pilin [Zhihengliuella salsuginis]GHD02928.1 hypothetical protein GCM10008096_08610 [Zhihengliuella salsuginis]
MGRNQHRAPPIRRDSGRSETGSSTAEVAVLLPALAVLLAFALGAGGLGITQIQLEEGARVAARELARGESAPAAADAARRHAGGDALISVDPGGDYSRVSIRRDVRIPLVGTHVVTLSADAEARTESPGAG